MTAAVEKTRRETKPDHQVVIIGAGLSGLGTAIELRASGVTGIVILERASAVGGTWRDNTYPGVGVDIPAQAYQFRYALNPDWSRLFAKGEEVLAYVRRIADDYGLRELIQFDSEVGAREWDDTCQLWRLSVNGKEITARFVISAVGPFPQVKPPNLPGLEDFQGTVLHSASWDHDVELTGKRVGIIGTGASAVQIIPEIARDVAQLDVFQRTPIWVVPKIDPRTPPALMRLFRRAPKVHRVVRDGFEFGFQLALIDGVIHYRRLRLIVKGVRKLLANGWYRAQIPDPELREKLTPDYDFGCKRPAISNGYLRSFNRGNVDLITDPIERITADGIRTVSGVELPAEVLILATGYRLSFDPEVYRENPVSGRDGFDLCEFYQDHRPWNYHGTSIPGLPNYFTIFGHYGWTGGTWHSLVETASVHIARVIAEAQRRGASVAEVRESAADEWTATMRGRYATSLFNLGSCATANSYYFDHHGESAYVRPMSTRAARKAARTFSLDDYRFSGPARSDRTMANARSTAGKPG